MEKLPRSISEFYRYGIFVIYAVIIGESFQKVTLIFIPLDNLVSFHGFQSAFMLIFVYFFIVSSWIGYFKSTSYRPHSDNKFGLLRFGIDILIVYEFYYLVNIIPDVHYYPDVFMYVFPIILLSFTIWDIVKYFEFRRESKNAKVNRKNRLTVTLIFFGVFLVLSLTYSKVLTLSPLLYDGNNVWNIVFIGLSWLFIFWYRHRKWNIPKHIPRRMHKNV